MGVERAVVLFSCVQGEPQQSQASRQAGSKDWLCRPEVARWSSARAALSDLIARMILTFIYLQVHLRQWAIDNATGFGWMAVWSLGADNVLGG